MKNLVIQYYIDLNKYASEQKKSPIPNEQSYIEKYSEHSFKKYCEKYGHSFLRVTEPKINYSHPTWERMDLWLDESWFDEYDQICYVDTDVFALPWAPDIFSYCDLSCFNKASYWKCDKAFRQKKHLSDKVFLSSKASPERWHECCFQAGVFVLTKESRDASFECMKDYKNPEIPDDCVMMRYALSKSDAKINTIPHEFDVKWHPGLAYPQGTANKDLKDLYFLHAFGSNKRNNPKYYMSTLEKIYGKL